MAQVVVEKKRGSIKNGIPLYVWSYEIQKPIVLDQNNIPAISFTNKQESILNKEAVVFPDNLEDINPLGHIPNLADDEEKISFSRGRREDSQKSQDINFMQEDDDDDDDEKEEASILIQKLRELVIRFEKLLTKFLDPDIPTSRKLRKKYLKEREMFRNNGYKDFINSIDLKVDALINFEQFDMEMFCKDKDPNWFKEKIKGSLDGNFYSAQDIVNSVMQIVKNEEYGIPIRRVVTMLR